MGFRSMIMGGGIVVVAGFVMAARGFPLSPELLFGLGMLPIVGMSATASDIIDQLGVFQGNGNGGGNGLPPDVAMGGKMPDWLLITMGVIEFGLLLPLLVVHWVLLSGAVPFGNVYLGDAQAIGGFLAAVGVGELTLAGVISGIISFVGIALPGVLWYLAFKTNLLGDFQGFLNSSHVTRVLFFAVCGVYLAIVGMEISIMLDRIAELNKPPGPIPDFGEKSSAGSMIILSFIFTSINFLLGALSAKLVIGLEGRMSL